MKITIIGSGYVGLVSGVCLSEFGHEVTCVDKSEDRVRLLSSGAIPIYEPGLEALMGRNVEAGRLKFAVNCSAAVAESDVVFIAVGTPSRAQDGHADLSYVYSAVKDVAKAIAGYTVIVNKSTVPVGTGDEVEQLIRASNPKANFSVVSNPEFLREGAAIDDFMAPDRVIVGSDDPRASAVMATVYASLDPDLHPIVFTSRRSAELTKYAANAFLAVKLAYINEIADLCEHVGADVQDVSLGMGLDSRIGRKFLNAGPGYGGSCFPKDTLALVRTAQDHNTPIRVIETIVGINETRKRAMARKIKKAVGGSLRGKTIAILGLTFKPNTDDIRESPALSIIQALLDAGAKVKAYDPEGIKACKTILPDIFYAESIEGAADGADALVIITEWDVFRHLDFDRLKTTMAAPVLVDLRNIYSSEMMNDTGFSYHGIGGH